MASSSNNEPRLNPPELFSFSITPASILKHAIGALCDPHLNSSGTARIGVCEAGFEITVWGDPIEVVGFLSLNAAALTDFKCNTRVTKMIKLDKGSIIAQFMDLSGDNDVIKIFSSNKTSLSFSSLGFDPTGVPERRDLETSFSKVKLLNRFPTISCAFEVDLTSDNLNPILRSLTDDIYREKRSRARVEKIVSKKSEMSQVEIKGDTDYIWFEMTNWMALEAASRLTDTCYVYCVKDPLQHIMLRYSLKEVGDFVILKATKMRFVEKDPTVVYTFATRT